MTTAHASITGRISTTIIFREVWPDQIDDLNQQCQICQKFNQLVSCNVYVPVIYDRDGEMIAACRCCAPNVVLDHHALDTDEDAVIEYAKEK